LTAVLELGFITDRRKKGGGTHRPDPWDGLQALAFGVGLPHPGQLFIGIR
jgi:hypothetical protein